MGSDWLANDTETTSFGSPPFVGTQDARGTTDWAWMNRSSKISINWNKFRLYSLLRENENFIEENIEAKGAVMDNIV